MYSPRSNLNAPSPVHRLPDELLNQVFSAYIDALHPRSATTQYAYIEDEFDEANERIYPWRKSNDCVSTRWWLILTQVCQAWRYSALANPLLWSSITNDTCKNVEVCRMFISRTAGAPLNVDLRDTFTHWLEDPLTECLDIVFSESDRIVSLYLDLPPELTQPLISIVEGRPLKSLKRFHFHPSRSGVFQADVVPIMLPGALASHQISCISLKGVFVDWRVLASLPSLPLTHLLLSGMWTNQPSIVGVAKDCLKALRNFPLLSVLILKHCIPSCGQDVVHDTIQLPYLTRLKIKDGNPAAFQLLQYLALPPSVELSIIIIIPADSNEDDFDPFSYVLTTRRQSDDDYSHRDVSAAIAVTDIDDLPSIQFELGAYGGMGRLDVKIMLTDFTLDLLDILVHSVIVDLRRSGISSLITAFTISSQDYCFPQNRLEYLFNGLDRLETLTSTGKIHFDGIPWALWVNEDGTVPAPKLQTLRIWEFNTDRANLADCLEERLAEGYKLETLSILYLEEDTALAERLIAVASNTYFSYC